MQMIYDGRISMNSSFHVYNTGYLRIATQIQPVTCVLFDKITIKCEKYAVVDDSKLKYHSCLHKLNAFYSDRENKYSQYRLPRRFLFLRQGWIMFDSGALMFCNLTTVVNENLETSFRTRCSGPTTRRFDAKLAKPQKNSHCQSSKCSAAHVARITDEKWETPVWPGVGGGKHTAVRGARGSGGLGGAITKPIGRPSEGATRDALPPPATHRRPTSIHRFRASFGGGGGHDDLDDCFSIKPSETSWHRRCESVKLKRWLRRRSERARFAVTRTIKSTKTRS